MKTEKKIANEISGLLTTLLVVFVLYQVGCGDEKAPSPKPDISDYYASEFFNSKLVSGKVSYDDLVKLAFEERKKHQDKEGGNIKFYENGSDTIDGVLPWAYVEYHYPANPAKENAKDEYGDGVELKVLR